ncbi:MAG: crotonase [bacterium]|nr:crotonase [bacterium]
MAVFDLEFEDLRLEFDDGVVVLILDRPDQLNAYSAPMGISLGQAYRACDEDDTVRAVVLTGAGRAFCAGADLTAGADTFAKQDQASFSSMGVDPPAWEVRKPVIAALNGHAVGIGLGLAMQCDLRIAAAEGKYGFLHVRRGMIPDCGSHWTVPRIIGHARAADLLLSGRIFRGPEALELGLANHCLPSEQVLPAAVALAREIAEHAAPLSVAISKKLLWQSSTRTRDEMARFETELHHHIMGTPDAIEGAMAYIEKRKPRWQLSPTRDWPDKWPS